MEEIDLRICREGDILISSQGAILEYISPTPWQGHTYLDHVVRFIEDQYGEKYNKVHSSYCTRTNDGFAFAFSSSSVILNSTFAKTSLLAIVFRAISRSLFAVS